MNTNKTGWHLPPWQCGKLPQGVTRRCYVGARKTVRHFNLMNFCHDQDTAAVLVACHVPKHAQSRKKHGLVNVDQHPKCLILEFLAGKPFPCDHHWHAGLVFDAHAFFNGFCPVCNVPIDSTNNANDGDKNNHPFAGVCCDCGLAHAPYSSTLTAAERSAQVLLEVKTGIDVYNSKHFVNETVVHSIWDPSIRDPCYKWDDPWKCAKCGKFVSGTTADGSKKSACAVCLTPRFMEHKISKKRPYHTKTPIMFHDTATSHWQLRCDRCEATYRAIGTSTGLGEFHVGHCDLCSTKCESCLDHNESTTMELGVECLPLVCGPNPVTCCSHISTACRYCKLHLPNKVPKGYGYCRVEGEPGGGYSMGVEHWCPDSERAISDIESDWVPDEPHLLPFEDFDPRD